MNEHEWDLVKAIIDELKEINKNLKQISTNLAGDKK